MKDYQPTDQKDQPANDRRDYPRHPHSHGIFLGFIIIIAGVLFLLQRLNFPIPEWIFSWQVILIVVGFLIGIKSGFRNFASLILILMGAVFLANDYFVFPVNINRLLWPVAIIIIGLLVIARPRGRCYRRHHWRRWQSWQENMNWKENMGKAKTYFDPSAAKFDPNDRLDCTSVFSSQNRTVISKDFKGGELVAVFGGIDLDLTKADINGTVVIDASIVFGGVKIFIPSNWELRTNVSHVFAGIEDKRKTQSIIFDPNKVLVITGSVLFGGIEVRGF